MESINFWLMDACATALVFFSAVYGRTLRNQVKTNGSSRKHVLIIPDALLISSFDDEDEGCDVEKGEMNREEEKAAAAGMTASYVAYCALVIVYFALTTSTVILAKRFPLSTASLQYICIFTFITVGLMYVRPGRSSFLLAFILCLLWTASGVTSYRWLANNVIVCFSVMVASHIRFKNFFYLQIFIWVAFMYDVIVLSGIQLRAGEWSFFSYDEADCKRLICEIFEHNYHFQMPAVFTVNIMPMQKQVFIGTGDILIGSFVSNFAVCQFGSLRHGMVASLAFGCAVAALSAVSLTPFPALLTIVPACSLSIVLIAAATGKFNELIYGSNTASHMEEDTLCEKTSLAVIPLATNSRTPK